MVPDDLPGEAESDARSLGFGGVERHKYPLQNIGRNTRTVIRDFNGNVIKDPFYRYSECWAPEIDSIASMAFLIRLISTCFTWASSA